jgi:hypothetical protein
MCRTLLQQLNCCVEATQEQLKTAQLLPIMICIQGSGIVAANSGVLSFCASLPFRFRTFDRVVPVLYPMSAILDRCRCLKQ